MAKSNSNSTKKRPTTKAGREAARVTPKPAQDAACNAKELAFVDQWMLDFNGTQAMLRAGITTKPQVAAVYASVYLTRPHVALEIAARRKRSAEQLSQARERMIEELQRIGLSNIEDVVEWNKNAVTLKASASLSAQQKAAIAEITETRGSRTRTLRVKMHPKIDAIAHFLKQTAPSDEGGVKANGASGAATIIIEGGPTGLEVSVESGLAANRPASSESD